MLQGVADFVGRFNGFVKSWYFLPTLLGLASVPLIFILALWLPMGWLPGDWQSCAPDTESEKVEKAPNNKTIFSWLQCGAEDGESNSTTLRNFGLVVAGFYALIFAYWRAKIADAEKKINLRESQTNQGSTSDFASDAKWAGVNFANADLSGSNFEGANFGWTSTGGREIEERQDGGEQGGSRASKDQEVDDTVDSAGDQNGAQ